MPGLTSQVSGLEVGCWTDIGCLDWRSDAWADIDCLDWGSDASDRVGSV